MRTNLLPDGSENDSPDSFLCVIHGLEIFCSDGEPFLDLSPDLVGLVGLVLGRECGRESVQDSLAQELSHVASHHHLQAANIRDELILVVGLAQPLLELLGLPAQAGEDDERGDEEDDGPDTVENHRDAPQLGLRAGNKSNFRQGSVLIKALIIILWSSEELRSKTSD